MQDHIDQVLIDRNRIARRVEELAVRVADDFRRDVPPDETPQVTLIAIATGSLIFLADLIRKMPLMMRLRLVTVSSYPGTATSSRGARLQGELPEDLAGSRVLIVDDVLDSGRTLELVRELVRERGPASLRTCVLLRKGTPAAMRIAVEYVGFDIPDAFVVGYGLDYDGFYRNLPDVVTLKGAVIEGEGET